jgi:hypothetical protein
VLDPLAAEEDLDLASLDTFRCGDRDEGFPARDEVRAGGDDLD